MCSKRCANPVRPGLSFLDPTWYHWFTCTIGSLRSTCRITWSPLGSVYFSNSSFGAAPVVAAEGAAAVGLGFSVLGGADCAYAAQVTRKIPTAAKRRLMTHP